MILIHDLKCWEIQLIWTTVHHCLYLWLLTENYVAQSPIEYFSILATVVIISVNEWVLAGFNTDMHRHLTIKWIRWKTRGYVKKPSKHIELSKNIDALQPKMHCNQDALQPKIEICNKLFRKWTIVVVVSYSMIIVDGKYISSLLLWNYTPNICFRTSILLPV